MELQQNEVDKSPAKPSRRRIVKQQIIQYGKCKKSNGLADKSKPEEIFISVKGRKWTFLETVKDAEELNNIRMDKYHCCASTTGQWKLTMNCLNKVREGCNFKLMAQKTDRDRFHLYVSDAHTCRFKNRQNNEQLPAGDTPLAVLTKIYRNREYRYNYVKTVHSFQELDAFRFEHQCYMLSTSISITNFKIARLRCQRSDPARGDCPFTLLAWRPGPDKSQIHVYSSYNEHNHSVTPADGRAEQNRPPMWSEEKQPPASFTTPNGGRQWIFLETIEAERELNNLLLENLKQKYKCYLPHTTKFLGRIFCRATLYCITGRGPKKSNCPFQLLAQRTDRGHYHLYGSGVYTCLHIKNKGELSTQENKEKNGEEKEIRNDKEEEESKLQNEEEKDDCDDRNVQEVSNKANAVTIRPHGRHLEEEDDGMQFIGFVEHPESEGVKMRQLDEPKEEHDVEENEESANLWQKVQMPKLEIKEETTENEPGLLNRGQHERLLLQANIGSTAAVPSAAINHKHQPVMVVRERWWAKENRVEAVPKNEKRYLRERKRRIDYGE